MNCRICGTEGMLYGGLCYKCNRAPEPQPPEIPKITIIKQSQKFQNGATWNIQKGLSEDGRKWRRSIRTREKRVTEGGILNQFRLIGEQDCLNAGTDTRGESRIITHTSEWTEI